MTSFSLFFFAVILLGFIFQAQSHQLFKPGDESKKFETAAVITNLCEDKNVAIIFHENDCSRFWKCKGEFAYLQVCAGGKKFDTKTLMCTSPKHASCRDGQTHQ